MDLVAVLAEIQAQETAGLTEADTRAQFIDPVLRALGWSSGSVKREPCAGWTESRGFIDYLLTIDERPTFVIEAKRTGRQFEIPAALRRQRTTTFKKLLAVSNADLREALDQCLRYAQHTGAPYACATNGLEWVFFKPSHQHRSLPEARVIIFNGPGDVLKSLDLFEHMLSYGGVEKGQCEKEMLGREVQVPVFAKRLADAYPYRRHVSAEEEEYSHILDQMLRHYIVDLTADVDFDECYVPVRANRRTSKSLDAIVTHQVSALNNNGTTNASDFSGNLVDQSVLPNLVSGRTVILHGQVGVGKTSFLRNCEILLRREGKLDRSVWARVDLLPFRDRPFEISNVNALLSLLCTQIQVRVSEATQELGGKYDPDTWGHLRDIYNQEVRKFQKARFPDSNDADANYLEAARSYVWDLSKKDPQDHLVRVIRWLTVNCKLPVILVLDNSDQLGLDFQEFLYKLAETFQSNTSAVTIVSLRTEAMASHRIREHSLASVDEQFQLEKAPLPVVLGKRFELMERKLAQLGAETPQSQTARERISVLMDTLQYEANQGSDAFRIVDAAGNGSLRDSLHAVAAVFRSSPKQMDRLVVEQHKHSHARLDAERTLRALLKEDLASAESRKLIPNIFIVESQVVIPYSLAIRIIQQISSKTVLAEYTVGALLNDLAVAGIDRAICGRVVARLRQSGFVTTAHMLKELREVDSLRVSALGDVMIDIILNIEAYYASMVFDTVIYDRDTYNNLKSAWNSDAEYRKKFAAMARLFAAAIVADDELLRRRLMLSALEPSLSASLPGVFPTSRASTMNVPDETDSP